MQGFLTVILTGSQVGAPATDAAVIKAHVDVESLDVLKDTMTSYINCFLNPRPSRSLGHLTGEF